MATSREIMSKVLEQYFEAWEQQDSDLCVELFTLNAIYRAKPFGIEEYKGKKEIKEYWNTHPVAQQVHPNPRLIHAAFNEEESICFAEWENTFTTHADNTKITRGMLLLAFEGEYIRELREHFLSMER